MNEEFYPDSSLHANALLADSAISRFQLGFTGARARIKYLIEVISPSPLPEDQAVVTRLETALT